MDLTGTGGDTDREARRCTEPEIEIGGVVKGTGMWKSWRKSFDSPLLALLDLFDNAVDSSWTLLNIKGAPEGKPKIDVHFDDIGQNGVIIRNSCAHAIPPLKKVLVVYESSKGNSDVGENGVGVKHACASLARLSLVFTKTKYHFSIGVLMEDLQLDACPVLPSARFNFDDDLEGQLVNLAMAYPDTWRKGICLYGEGDLEVGIDRCFRHFHAMRNHSKWKDCENVFTVVLTRLRHKAFGQPTHHQTTDSIIEDEDESIAASNGLLQEFAEKLPFLYLHLHSLEISVQHIIIDTAYWEKKLVELSKFEIGVDQERIWSAVGDAAGSWSESPYEDPRRTIRLFLGFDPDRCSDRFSYVEDGGEIPPPSQETLSTPSRGQNKTSALKVYLYSRQSGRLIRVQNDPRSELGLQAGSTDFKQGLTVIIDDYNGTLPLNPTKQDTAFGNLESGMIFDQNIQEWTAALTHFYWSYNFERLGSSKATLTAAVSATKKTLEATFGGDDLFVSSPLCRGTFITYPNLKFTVSRGKQSLWKIRAMKKSRNAAEPFLGVSNNPTDLVSITRLDEKEAATLLCKREQAKSPNKRIAAFNASTTPQISASKRSGKRKRPTSAEESEIDSSWLDGLIDPMESESDDLISCKPRAMGSRLQSEYRAKVKKLTSEKKRTESELEQVRQERDDFNTLSQRLELKITGLEFNNGELNRVIAEIKSKNEKKKEKALAKSNRLREELEDRKRDAAEVHMKVEDLQREKTELCSRIRIKQAQEINVAVSSTSEGESGSHQEQIAKLARTMEIFKSRSESYQKQAATHKESSKNLFLENERLQKRINELETSELEFI